MDNIFVRRGKIISGGEWTKKETLSNGKNSMSRMSHNTLHVSLHGKCIMTHDFKSLRWNWKVNSSWWYPNSKPNVYRWHNLLFLKRNLNNLEKTFQVFQTFYEASRWKINWHKSCVIWASKKSKKWSWGEKKRLMWLTPNNKANFS